MNSEQIDTALQTYFSIDSKKTIDIAVINSIDYYDLIKFGNDVIYNYVNGILNRQQQLFDVLKFLNDIIDKFKDEKVCKSVNVSILTYLYDVIYARSIEAEHNQRLRSLVRTIMERKDYSSIVKALYRKKSATPSELSLVTGLSVQKIVSCIKGLGEAVKIVRSPFNNRKVNYCLRTDLSDYLAQCTINTIVPKNTVWYGGK